MTQVLMDYGWDLLILLAAGCLAGLINGVVGSGTLITFPMLLFMGYPPLTANVSSNLGLIPGSIAAAWQYRAAMSRYRALILRMLPLTMLGAVGGGALLLVLPSTVFESVVPILIAVALVVVLAQPLAQRFVAARLSTPTEQDQRASLGPALLIGLPIMGAYGGYFGAAQGILLLALLGVALGLEYREVNGFKNMLSAVANVVSGLMFAIVAPQHVDWVAVVCLALGATLGGAIGGKAAQLLPQSIYRLIILIVGVAALWSTLAR